MKIAFFGCRRRSYTVHYEDFSRRQRQQPLAKPAMTTRLVCFALVLPALLALSAAGQAPKKGPAARRFGVDFAPLVFPQKAPDEAIQSVVKAVDSQRIDYLLAQLADPAYVDRKVKEYAALIPKGPDDAKVVLAFDRLVRETKQHFLTDPLLVRELRAFAKDGAWNVEDTRATGTAKAVPAHQVFMKRIGDRWFLENRQQ
jgi:hypothetical protein